MPDVCLTSRDPFVPRERIHSIDFCTISLVAFNQENYFFLSQHISNNSKLYFFKQRNQFYTQIASIIISIDFKT